jgi:hypothetical protein
LLQLYYGAKWFGGRCQISGQAHDLINIGVARLLAIDDDKGVFELSGRLSQEVVVEVVEDKFQTVVPALQLLRAARDPRTEQGGVGEDLLGVALVEISSSNLSVADFARPFLPCNVEPPTWSKTAKLKLDRWGSLSQYGCDDLADFIGKVAEAKTNNDIVSPTPAARPDGVAFCPITPSTYFTVLFSSKLYSKNMSSKQLAPDLLSTELDKLYFLTNGLSTDKHGREMNLSARRRCFAARNRLGTHLGSLRIHCILPGVQGKKATELSHVEGNDIIVYIDKVNLDRILSANTHAEIRAALFE